MVPGNPEVVDGIQLRPGMEEAGMEVGGCRPEARVSSFPEKVRIVGRDLDKLLLAEKEKKKLSAAAHRAILDIRERYEVLLDEACRQNTILQGRIEEARNGHVCRAAERVTVKVTEKKEAPPPKTGAKTKPPKKKQVEVPVPPPKKKGKDDGTFTEVVSKKKRKKKKKAVETTKTVGPSAPNKTRRAIDKVKAKAPARAFIVSVGEAGAGEAKRQLWADLVKGVGAPRISRSQTLPRGDILVKPADEGTFKALKDMEVAGKKVREEAAKWPTVLIYDVDRDVARENLPGRIVDQNPELGLDKESVVPLFMKGSKTDEQVWWVCSVRPSSYRLVVGKSLYIGMSRCRVKEYVDVVRCFKCQHFGHKASKCQAKVDTCGRCAVQGHRAKDCQSALVKCANCGLRFQSGHKDCSALVKATFMVARRTDFGKK